MAGTFRGGVWGKALAGAFGIAFLRTVSKRKPATRRVTKLYPRHTKMDTKNQRTKNFRPFSRFRDPDLRSEPAIL
jgi:hypothetical protein